MRVDRTVEYVPNRSREQESEVRYHCEFAFLVGHYVSIESRQLVRPFEVLCDGRNAQQRLEHISLLLNGL